MKSKTLRAMIGGSVAAVMALSISLPIQANAEAGNTVTGAPTNFAQFMQYFNQYSLKGFPFSNTTVTVYKSQPIVVPTNTPAPYCNS